LNNDKSTDGQNNDKKQKPKMGISGKENFYIPNEYAKSKVSPLWQTGIGSSSTSTYTKKQVELLLKNPIANHQKLKDVSDWLWTNSPMYQNIIYYLSTILTYDYILYPDGFELKAQTMEKRFVNSAKSIRSIQTKYNFPLMTWRTLLNGDTYWYELSDKDNTIYQEIKSDICQLAFIDSDNLWRYYVDLSKITPSYYFELPIEIQEAYNSWITGGKNRKDREVRIDLGETDEGIMVIPEYLYLVSKKGKSMFAHLQKGQHDYPYLASMFPDLIALEENKDYFNDVLKANNIQTK